jgi:hypothetical protein
MYNRTINKRAETRREAMAPVPDVFQALSAAESGRAADERAALLPHAVAPVSVNIAPKSYGATAAPVDPVPNDEAAAPPAYRDASDLQ